LIKITGDVNQADVAALQRAVNLTRKHSRRNSTSSMVAAGIAVAKSGAAGSKTGKTKRELIDNPNRSGSGSRAKGALYSIIVKHQSDPDTTIPTNQKKDPRRKIQRRGLAAKVWRKLAKKIGGGGRGHGGNRWAKVRNKLKELTPEFTIINDLTYLHDAYPGIEATAIRKGTKTLIRNLERQTKRNMQSLWN